MNDHLRNEIYLFLDSNLIYKEIPPEDMVSSLVDIFELSGFDALMVYADWTFNLIPKDDMQETIVINDDGQIYDPTDIRGEDNKLMKLEEELDKESLEWERRDSENE